MFFLIGNGTTFSLPKDGKYLVGRHLGDIVITNSTVSRKHAEVEIVNDEAFLRDCNSKYFTKYNGKILLLNECVRVEDGAEIVFGEVKFSFKVIEKFVTCSTGVKDKEDELRSIIKQLGGEYLKEWNDTCTHLTTSEIMVTLKVLHAIMDNKKIVTPQFWKKYLENIKENKLLPNPSDFYPPLGENMIHSKFLDYNPNRKNIFLNKIFAFWKKKRQSNMHQIISKAGGDTILIPSIKNKSNEDLLKLMNIWIIMDPEDPNIENSYSTVLEAYKKNGKRIIPIQEIVLAILECSCKENCNPLFDRAKTVFVRETQEPGPSKIVIAETECFQIDSERERKPDVIPATLDQEKYLNTQVSDQAVAGTSKRTREVVAEVDISKKIKLDPEVVEMPKKRAASFFKKPTPEPSEPASKKPKSQSTMKLNPFSAMKLKMNEKESTLKEAPSLDLTDNPFGRIQLRKDLIKEDQTDDVILIEDNEKNSKIDNSKKRKSEDTLDNTKAKKRTKIITKKNRRFVEIASIDFTNLNHNISNGTWVDRNVKDEVKPTIKSMDEEEQKWCEKFNNSVVIVSKNLWRKDKENEVTNSSTLNQTNVKNFKKFKKVFVPKSGQIIKCSKVVYGESNLGIDYKNSDDEDGRNM